MRVDYIFKDFTLEFVKEKINEFSDVSEILINRSLVSDIVRDQVFSTEVDPYYDRDSILSGFICRLLNKNRFIEFRTNPSESHKGLIEPDFPEIKAGVAIFRDSKYKVLCVACQCDSLTEEMEYKKQEEDHSGLFYR